MSLAGYRVAQFLRAAFARPAAGEDALLEQHLPAPLQPAFARLSRAEQAHAVATLRALLRQGHTDPDLLAAALLHDLGKSRAPLRLLERVLIVLAQSWLPRRAARWGQGEPRGWRRPFVVAAQHPAWGEALVLEAGGSPRLAEIVLRHHDPLPEDVRTPVDRLLKALQAADGGLGGEIL
ncbi:MAG: HD domain-containing protein [Chloroflexi bacterium]|nr:HD domain-containing protein [Chloroflexota bacterium]